MGVKEQVFPDRFHMYGIAPQQARHQVVTQQRQHRRAARANGVGITGTLAAVATTKRQQNSFLRYERLDGVCAHNLGRQVHLLQTDRGDGR